jgi:hypothetical protein
MRPLKKSLRVESSVIEPAKQIGKTRERSMSLGGSWAKRWTMFPTDALISGTSNNGKISINHLQGFMGEVTYQASNCLVQCAGTKVLPLGKC